MTNVRSGSRLRQGPRSRGLLVTDFLLSEHASMAFAEQIGNAARDYDGFNLLGYDGCDLVWYSNQALAARHLPAGIYTLSNAALDTAWPKTERLRAGFDRVMKTASRNPVRELLALLRDAVQADDDALPDSGVSREMERTLSPIFIEGDGYGTRCSSIVLVDREGGIRFVERRYDRSGIVAGEDVFEFTLKSTARAERGSHVSNGTRNSG